MEQRLNLIVGLHQTNGQAHPILKGGIVMYATGEKPGKGTYQCRACGALIVLDDNTDTLPPCPKCHKTTFIKVA